jgi:hypothetical protein
MKVSKDPDTNTKRTTMSDSTKFTDKEGKIGADHSPSKCVEIDYIGILEPTCKKCGNPLLGANLGAGGASLKCKGCGILGVYSAYNAIHKNM